MRAFGYVRLSKYDPATTSPQRQKEAIQSLCKTRGWKLADVFDDIDVSGYNGQHRPGLERMLSRLGEVGAVVVYRIDRLARSSVHFRGLLDRFDQAGVEFVASDLQVDSSASGRLIRDIIARMAEFESDQLSERSKRMAAFKKQQGEWFGQVPFGWRRGEDKKLELMPEEFAVIQEAARRYVAGESLRRIAPTLGQTHANLARILRSERVLEALPTDLAGRLATEMAERGRTGTTAAPSLLGGVARCGVCEGPMTMVAQKAQDGRRARGSYSCRELGHVSISRGFLDEHVSGEVLAAIDVDRLTKRMARRKRQQPKAMKATEIEARLELLEQDHYDRGTIPRDRFLRLRESLLKKLAEAREAQEQANSGPDIPLELARQLPELWDTLNTIERRRIVRAVVKEIRVSKAKSNGKIDPKRVEIAWR